MTGHICHFLKGVSRLTPRIIATTILVITLIVSLGNHKDFTSNILNRELKSDRMACEYRTTSLNGRIRDLEKMNSDLAISNKKLQQEIVSLKNEVHLLNLHF